MKKMIKPLTIVLLFSVCFISCGMYADISDAEYQRRIQVQKQIDLTQAEYTYQIDSLYNEYYKKTEIK
jgi:hypothetical protein